jgi:hypothetical protein
MDRQTIEAAERVTAWSRERALSAVLAVQASTPSEAAEAEESPLDEGSEAAFHYTGEQTPAAERQQ